MAYRHQRLQRRTETGPRARTPRRTDTARRAAVAAAEAQVAAALGTRFAWFLAPVRLNALAEDLRAMQRMRDLDLGLVVVAIVLASLARSSDTEGRVRDAFGVYRQLDPTIDVGDEAFRKAMHRAAPVLRHLLTQWMGERAHPAAGPPLRGRLQTFTDLLITDGSVFKVAAALAAALPGSGSTAALKLHAVYSVRADGPVSVEATAGREHDSPHFRPTWVAGALYLWDLGDNDYDRLLAAVRAGAYFVQRLKDTANPRWLAWYDAQGQRHAAPRGPRGSLLRLNDALATWPALQTGQVLDLDVVVEDAAAGSVLRVVCVPTDGQDRYYLTNLARAHFTPHDLAEIYGARWDVELLFKDWQGGCRIDEVTRIANLQTLRAVVYGALLAHLLSREVARSATSRPTGVDGPDRAEVAAGDGPAPLDVATRAAAPARPEVLDPAVGPVRGDDTPHARTASLPPAAEAFPP